MTEKLVDDLGVFDKVVDHLLAGNTDQERAMVKSMAKQAHEKGVELDDFKMCAECRHSLKLTGMWCCSKYIEKDMSMFPMGVYLRRTLVVRENARLCGIEGKGWEAKK